MDLVETGAPEGLGIAQDRIFIERFLVDSRRRPRPVASTPEPPRRRMQCLADEVTVILGGKKSVVGLSAR